MDASSNIVAEIGLLIYPNCQLAAIYGLTDLFRIAGDWPQQKNCTERRPCIRVSHWGSPPDVRQGAANRLVCLWDSYAEQPHDLSYIIAPPSIVMPEDMLQMPAEAEWLTDRHAEGSKICSVCAGAFVLAESGLIDGRRVTTHWAFADLLSRRFPKIDAAAQDMVLDDGDILTAGGILAWTDLGLTLVDRLMGPSAMLATAKFLLIDPPGRQQLPYHTFNPRFDHGDEAIVRVQHHVHAHAADLDPRLRKLAKAKHLRFYGLMLRFPISGVFLTVWSGDALDVFGCSLNSLFTPDAQLAAAAAFLHNLVLPAVFYLAISAHFGAVTKHHFAERRPLEVRRMLR